jgi:hypothetical protein
MPKFKVFVKVPNPGGGMVGKQAIIEADTAMSAVLQARGSFGSENVVGGALKISEGSNNSITSSKSSLADKIESFNYEMNKTFEKVNKKMEKTTDKMKDYTKEMEEYRAERSKVYKEKGYIASLKYDIKNIFNKFKKK